MTAHQKIIDYMRLNPNDWFIVSDFQRPDSECFIGYEAGTRIGDLMRKGLIESRWSHRTTQTGRQLKEYKIKEYATSS